MHEFPIKTATSCKLKWVWSTLFLNSGVTRSCHRTAESELTPENLAQFHNTEVKIQDRVSMLNGQWPDQNCGYCKKIEMAGGISDRVRHLSLPYHMPPELLLDNSAVEVSPTVLEVYFDNTCNLGCLYCTPKLSSFIAAENDRYGKFQQFGIVLENPKMHYKSLVSAFWDWFPEGFPKLARLNILGGEPFYQKEFDRLLYMIEQHPNPDCELNIVTNLMVSDTKFQDTVSKFQSLYHKKQIKRIDITCSIDCWGAEQEYVRWGLDLAQWQKNFNQLLNHDHFYLNINQTISPLTIKTMPLLLQKLSDWRRIHQVGHWFSEVTGCAYLEPHILGGEIFEHDFKEILALMPTDTEENILATQYMLGIINRIRQHQPDPVLINDMFVFLEEKDRRRRSDWKKVFPWLTQFQKYVV